MRRGTGTTPLPSSPLQRPTPETGRIGGSSLGGPASSQPARANGRGDRRRHGPTQPGALVWMGPEQPRCRWMTYSNASKPGKKYSRSWQEHTRASASMFWAYSTTPWERTGRTGTRRRRIQSCERLSYGTSCRPCCIHRTVGSRGDRGSRWWKTGTLFSCSHG